MNPLPPDLEMVPDLDLGDDHFLRYTQWHPDDLPENRRRLGVPTGPMPLVEKWGAIVRHYRPDGILCEGVIEFDGSWQRVAHRIECLLAHKERRPLPSLAVWTVECWDPLTLSPSLLCNRPIADATGRQIGVCGDHGFVKAGKWVRA